MGVCNCSMFCCTLPYVHSSSAITLIRKIELVGLLGLSCWCLVIAVWLFLTVPFVLSVVYECGLTDHAHPLPIISGSDPAQEHAN